MRYNHRGYQAQARKCAENRGQCDGRDFDQRARDLRAENMRRAAAAERVRRDWCEVTA